MKKKEKCHLISALAIYICKRAKSENIMLTQVDITELSKEIGADCEIREQAFKEARKIIMDFY